MPDSRWAIVSSKLSFPARTRLRATAPLKALATLAIRMWSVGRGALLRFTSARPARSTVNRPLRYIVAIAPGGPPGASTNRSRPCWTSTEVGAADAVDVPIERQAKRARAAATERRDGISASYGADGRV